MAIRPQTVWPTVPDLRAVDFQRPVDGSTLQALVQAQNHLVGWRFRRANHTEIEWNVGGIARPDVELLLPTGVFQTVKVTWRTQERAQYIWVNFVYQADRATAAGGSYVDADLRLAFGGAVVDAGCRWDQDRGDLASSQYIAEAAAVRSDAYALKSAHSGTSPNDAPAAFPTVPRPLNVGTSTGVDVEVRLVTSNVRIHAVDVWELFTAELAE